MKFTYEILPERRVILQRYAGSFSLADLLASTQRLWDDPLYSRSYDGIVDLSATSVAISMNDLRSLIGFLRTSERTSTGRWGAVANSPLVTACAMIYQRAIAPVHEFEVFSTWDAACDYIGRRLPPFAA